MSSVPFDRARSPLDGFSAAAVALGLGLVIAGCATTTTTTPPATRTPAPAMSTGADVERCQAAGGVWRNGMCATMGGGGY